MLLLCALLSSVLGTAAFGPPVLTGGTNPPVRLYPEQIAALVDNRPPEIAAPSALVYDLDAGQLLYAKDQHAARPPASTSKMMTALLVLRSGRLLTETVTVPAQALKPGGSTMGLQAGETLTLEQLLYGLLIPSGNDAAVTLAHAISGGVEPFVALMNETAASMGLQATHFTNPHGLDEPGVPSTSSAADLLVLAREALAYPVFARIVGTESIEVAGHGLVNTNDLLRTYRDAGGLRGDGIKTGTTDEAGQCLVGSVSRGGHRLIVVVLGSDDRYADADSLVDWAERQWDWQPVIPEGPLAWLEKDDGELYRLRTAAEGDVFLPKWQWPLVRRVRVMDANVPLNGAQPVGVMQLVFDGQVLKSVPLAVWQGP